MCFQQSAVYGREGRNCWYTTWKWDDGKWNIIQWRNDQGYEQNQEKLYV